MLSIESLTVNYGAIRALRRGPLWIELDLV